MPDFIGVGPPRTATTWLYEMLRGHAGFSAFRKETDFFTRFYGRGIDWYLKYFEHCERELPMGEFSPLYFASDDACGRIARDIPRCRIICSFRDPVDRAWSHWRLMVRNLWTRLDFEEAAARHRDIRESSRYGHYLEKWIAAFGRDNVLILFYEDLERDPQAFVDQVSRFIGAPAFSIAGLEKSGSRVHTVDSRPRHPRVARNVRNLIAWLNDRRHHRAAAVVRHSRLWKFCFEGGPPFERPTPEADMRLRIRLAPEIEILERLTGRDLSEWKAPTGAYQRQSSGENKSARA